MKKYIKSRESIITTSFLMCFIIMMLFGFNDEIMSESAVYKNIVIPYININITVFLAGLTIFTVSALIILSKIKIDYVIVFLILRIPLYCMPLIYLTGEFKIGIFYTVFQCVLAYFIGLNSNMKFDSLIKNLFLYSIAIFLEEIYVLIVNKISIFASDLKWYMVLPMGKSNYISCVLLPIYVLVSQYYKENDLFCIIYTIISLLAILASGSKLALLILIMYIVYENFIKNLFKKHNVKKVFIMLTELLGITIVLFFVINKFHEGIGNIIIKFTQNNIFENRLLVYKECMDVIFEHILLGRSAFSYKVYDAVKAHNFLLESLVQTGLLGTFLYVFALIYVYKKMKGIKQEKIKKSIISFFVIYLIQGLAEPNLFGAVSDTFFWLLLGISVSDINKFIDKDREEK